jgi:hypothetical protein
MSRPEYPDHADWETIIRDFLGGQYSNALRVVAFNTARAGPETCPRTSPPAPGPRKSGRGAEQNRALQLLAGPHGCTEAIMLAHGFTAELLVDLLGDGLAMAAAGITYAGNRPIEVTRLTITDLGRQALAGT